MKNRYEFGMEMLNKVDGHAGEAVAAPLGDLGTLLVEWFGDIYGRDKLTLREREIATIAMLTVLNREPQLRVHLGAGSNVGLTRQEMEEVMTHSVLYGGFPTAINGMNLLNSMTLPGEVK
ncbi:carboxymuconolactone decarboxylase family protein [Paenibacillus sacheonensis]|uniref:Carboxymuconolactone decarboxylase family protein n=1 Tax=Paenibacillus sacheonensis TaxID=742054 RepID=A0A7X4YQ36_9BACL|nr:carboxymuconolactone decarboxylase family protein [Paenibacillus sacheonensis]MBM7566253.1 4-carboxymuconolactone decarboxylase [Paenibacillus sacheonensis]NBC70460.1 carboxymuconolactone decarboxylase family protein [Paenibacillus sacheonensis]